MHGAVPLLPHYAFMAWWLVKAQGELYFYLYLYFTYLYKHLPFPPPLLPYVLVKFPE